MARFVFRLAGVLRQRRRIERQKQRELALVQGEMTKLQTSLRTLQAEVKTAGEELRHSLVGRLDLAFLAAHRRYILAMERRGAGLVQHIAQIQHLVEVAQKALAAAAVQRKVMEKLRERQFERWRAEMDRKEAIESDEIGTRIGAASMATLHYRNHDQSPDIESDGSDGFHEDSA